MTIDILSDLHLDFYFYKEPSKKALETTYTHIFTDNQKRSPGEVLIVAGDIGHYNKQNIDVLKKIKEVFKYKHIICVLGNHDYYLLNEEDRINYRKNSLNRTNEMRQLINSEEGMHCLDGDIVEIEGVRIGGCDSWYDGQYIKTHFDRDDTSVTDGSIDALWHLNMNDAKFIHAMQWQEFAKIQKKKIESIYKDVDIMVTHVNPSIRKEHISSSYQEEMSTGFFSFDGERFIKDGTMKYWIYGHTHIEQEYSHHGVQCICNPMGYPGENGNGEWTWVKSIQVTEEDTHH